MKLRPDHLQPSSGTVSVTNGTTSPMVKSLRMLFLAFLPNAAHWRQSVAPAATMTSAHF